MDGGAGLAVFDPDPAEKILVFKKYPQQSLKNQAIIRSRGFAVSTRCLFDVCG